METGLIFNTGCCGDISRINSMTNFEQKMILLTFQNSLHLLKYRTFKWQGRRQND